MLLEMSGEITPERMKGQSLQKKIYQSKKSKNNTQLWMRLVMDVKSDAIKSSTA